MGLWRLQNCLIEKLNFSGDLIPMENESLSHINCDGVLYYLDEKNINFLFGNFIDF